MCKLVSVQEERQVRALNEDTVSDLNETVTEKKKGTFYLGVISVIKKNLKGKCPGCF